MRPHDGLITDLGTKQIFTCPGCLYGVTLCVHEIIPVTRCHLEDRLRAPP